jgi:integrase
LKIASAKKDKYRFQSVKKAIMIPVTNLQRQIPMLDQAAGGSTRSTENFTVKRRYLTEREVERLIEAAKTNRHGHRDATMIIVADRHGLRASEFCGLEWQ